MAKSETKSKPKENYQYNPKRRKLAKIYSRQKLIMSFGSGILFPLLVICALFFTGALENIASWSLSFGKILGIVIFVFVISAIIQILEFPLYFYSNFIYEHKYSLSNQKFPAWLKDYGKETFISYLMTIPLQTITAYLIISTKYWWLCVAGINVAFDIFTMLIYPTVILPFLYKLEPYKDKNELKVIFSILKKVGAKDIKHIKVQKESEKSNKVNAFFAGFGKTKTIVFYDNLLNGFTKREVRTVIAHELGHYVHKDIDRTIIFDAIKSVLVFFLADRIIRNSFAVEIIPLHLVPIISAILIVIGVTIMPISMAYSRKLENAADKFALDTVKDPLAQISTEKRLSDHDLVDERPNKFIEFWFYSHPCTEERIRRVKVWMEENKIKG
ncbi:M48 family metallopeptidase [Candidatus Woesearchaeota archaeon]|nr:M48 family metallopeptidase [Candidatus Woesearchaeota archaeon]